MRTTDRLAEGEPSEGDGRGPAAADGREGQGGPPGRSRHPTRTPERMALVRARFDPGGPSGPRTGGVCKGHLKVDEILRDEDRPAYAELIRNPATRVKDALRWLRARGYRVGKHAVQHHRARFRGMLRDLRRAADFAGSLGKLAKAHGPTTLSDITVTRLQQVLMERLMAAGKEKKQTFRDIPLDELKELTKLVDTAVSTRRLVEQMRRDFEETKRQIAREAVRAAKGGGGGAAVADRVRELLGIPPGEDSEV
jgi:hypothetical protein